MGGLRRRRRNDDEMRVTALLTGFYNSVEHVVGFVSRGGWMVEGYLNQG